MGGGASKLTLAEAKVHAGALWDEEAQDLFESLAEDSKDGKVGKQRLQKALKQLQGKRAKQQRQDSEVEEAAIAAEAAAAGEGAAAGVTAAAAAAGEAEADGRADRVAAIKAAQTVRHAVTVTILYGSMAATEDTKALLADVGADRIISMTGRFYEKMFADKHLQKFVRKPDDPHADRLGSWIIEKMGGGPVWTSRRPPDARTKAHRDAWTSPRREPEKHGRRFKLDDCRAWMRNMFWAARDEGLDAHEPFFNFFVYLIGRFIMVYENSAGAYAQESANWSKSADNIAAYHAWGNVHEDVIDQGVY